MLQTTSNLEFNYKQIRIQPFAQVSATKDMIDFKIVLNHNEILTNLQSLHLRCWKC